MFRNAIKYEVDGGDAAVSEIDLTQQYFFL